MSGLKRLKRVDFLFSTGDVRVEKVEGPIWPQPSTRPYNPRTIQPRGQLAVPGVLDWRDLRETVTKNRALPNHHAFIEAAHRLTAQGLSLSPIAMALGLPPSIVENLLQVSPRDARCKE